MNELNNVKMLGGIGSLLTLAGGFVPNIGIIILIAGLILVFLSVKKISDIYNKVSIFKNFMLYFLLMIIAIIAVFAIFFVTFGYVGGFGIIQELAAGNTMTEPEAAEFISGILGPLLTGCLVSLFVGWILLLISGLFYKKSFTELAEITNVGLFKTTGLIYLIGAGTTIFLVGFIIIFVALIMQAISFFSLPEELNSNRMKDITPPITPV